MTVAYRSSTNPSFATAANVTATEPAGAAQNDILRADLYVESTATVTAPAGWSNSFNGTTAMNNLTTSTGASTAYRHYAYWIRRGASAPALQWTFSSAFRGITVTAYSGAMLSGDPWGFCALAKRDDNSGKTWPDVSGATISANELLTWVGCGSNVGGAGTPPTGFAERIDAGTGVETADLLQAAIGSTGTVTGGLYAGGNNATTDVIMASLRQPGGGAPPPYQQRWRYRNVRRAS